MLPERSTVPTYRLVAGLTSFLRSSELLAIKPHELTGCPLHASTIRRWGPAAGRVWRRVAPTLRVRASHKEEKMAAIHETLAKCSAPSPLVLRR